MACFRKEASPQVHGQFLDDCVPSPVVVGNRNNAAGKECSACSSITLLTQPFLGRGRSLQRKYVPFTWGEASSIVFAIVRGFTGDGDGVRVAFIESRVGDARQAGVTAQVFQVFRPGVAHA